MDEDKEESDGGDDSINRSDDESKKREEEKAEGEKGESLDKEGGNDKLIEKDEENNLREKHESSIDYVAQDDLIDFKAGFDNTVKNYNRIVGVQQGSSDGVLAFMRTQQVGKGCYCDDRLV